MCFFSFSQTFQWCLPNGQQVSNFGNGTYLNIDGSGVDLTVSGMKRQWCEDRYASAGPRTYMATGINDGQSNGVSHTYQFKFSKLVNIEFRVEDVNFDTTNVFFKYYDYLHFSNSPIITSPFNNVIIDKGRVYPAANGVIKVYYQNITSFSITHGNGIKYNPGYIAISNLSVDTITPFKSFEEKLQSLPAPNVITLYPNPAEDFIFLKTNSLYPIQKIEVFSITGQIVINAVNHNNQLDVSELSPGTYFTRVYSNDEFFYIKFIKQ